MTANEAADLLEKQGRTEAARILRETAGRIQADAQALADVRTLDEWLTEEGPAETRDVQMGYDPVVRVWSCALSSNDRNCFSDEYLGATPDEARAKAAAWVREQTKG